jgi:uncharacterized protein (TIGR03000 family)
MYSVVLMMAMSTGGEVADIGRRGGCHGGRGGHSCCGCYGGGYGGCYGGGYASGGCMGYGGGYGGCTGYSGGMGYGGCYGGGVVAGGCYGGGVVTGGCYGGGVVTGGCYGGGFGYAGVPYVAPGTGTGGTGTGKGGEGIKKMPKPEGGPEASLPAPATILVNLPADATLTIDGEATTSTSSSRVFVSPTLQPGREYHYTLKAEVKRDGKPVSVEERVAVRAGETTPVTLTLPATSVAQR